MAIIHGLKILIKTGAIAPIQKVTEIYYKIPLWPGQPQDQVWITLACHIIDPIRFFKFAAMLALLGPCL